MIAGKSIALRRVEPADYPEILRWQNDPDVFRWMDYEGTFCLDDIRRAEERAAQEGHAFIIEAEGRPVGRIGLNNVRPRDRMASLYIFLGDRDLRGKGLGLDALMTILEYGFSVLNLRLIELWALDGNDRALHLYKGAGFLEDARLPQRSFKGGAYVDHIVMSVDRDGFERARAGA